MGTYAKLARPVETDELVIVQIQQVIRGAQNAISLAQAIIGDSELLKFETARGALKDSLRRVEGIVPQSIGSQGHNMESVTVEYSSPNPLNDDWIGVFSPANFSASTCDPENYRVYPPLLCTAPIKYQSAKYSNPDYRATGNGTNWHIPMSDWNQMCAALHGEWSFNAAISGCLLHHLHNKAP